MVLSHVKEAPYGKVSVVQSKATYLTAAGRQTKGPGSNVPSRECYFHLLSPFERFHNFPETPLSGIQASI